MSIFAEFEKENPTYDDIRDITAFQKRIKFTKIASLSSEPVKNAIADLIVKNLVQQLQSANLFGFASIQVDTKKAVVVGYMDDVYHFSISVDEESFTFHRAASTLEDLLKTSDLFMPFFNSVYKDVVSYIQGAMPNIVFVPHFCGYTFNFKIEDFHPVTKTATKNRIPNYVLMERLVPSIDKVESPVNKVKFERRGRTDVKLSGMLKLDDIDWIGWVSIEAPGNQNYSTMELLFELQSSTVDDFKGAGKRKPFDPQSIDSWKTPFLGFLKERIFCGFLQDWLSDIKVKSVR